MTSYIYNMVDTWNDGATTFTAVKMNVTDTASASNSVLLDLQIGGVSKFKVNKNTVVNCGSIAVAGNYISVVSNVGEILLGAASDLRFGYKAAANLRLGAADAAAPVAQTLSVQSVVAGTSNTAGANLTITGSQGTGTGAGGSIIFQVAPAGSTGTAQNALANVLQLNGSGGITGWDAATPNILALRNGGTSGTPVPQILRVYHWTDGTNSQFLRVGWAFGDAYIGTESTGSGGAKALYLMTNGSARWSIGTSGEFLAVNDNTYDIGASSSGRPRNVYVANDITSGGNVTVAAGQLFRFGSRGSMWATADGVFQFSNNAASDFGRINFGGSTSTFPALKRNSTALETKLADDSAYAPHAMQYLDVTDGITAPASATGRARIYVDTADGDLKVIFADGTVKTIVTDT